MNSIRWAVSILWLAACVLAPAVQHAGADALPGDRIVISLRRQRLYEYHHGQVTHILRVSTASGKPYFSERLGRWLRSRTPQGSFRIRRKIRGWKTAEHGRLYYPNYFDGGGRAIHGSVDLRPHRSHGCVRIPLRAARSFYRRNPIGTPVIID